MKWAASAVYEAGVLATLNYPGVLHGFLQMGERNCIGRVLSLKLPCSRNLRFKKAARRGLIATLAFFGGVSISEGFSARWIRKSQDSRGVLFEVTISMSNN